MRLIALDTETTGSSPASGDRCVSIGMVEIQDGRPTGACYHAFVDPGRPVHPQAYRIHGISDAFLRGKPAFRDVSKDILDFINNRGRPRPSGRGGIAKIRSDGALRLDRPLLAE